MLSTLEALDPRLTKFMDTKLLKRYSALYGELDIDSIPLKSQANIAKHFLLDGEKKLENFLDIVNNLQALPVAYSEIIKVLCIAATLSVATASNECLFSSLEIVKNYLQSTIGDDCLSHLLLIFTEKDLVNKFGLQPGC